MQFSKIDNEFVKMLNHTIFMCKISTNYQHYDDLLAQTEHLLDMLERKGITDIGNNPVYGE